MDFEEERRLYRQKALYTEEQRQRAFDLGLTMGISGTLLVSLLFWTLMKLL